MDSYSAFADNTGDGDTGLESKLREEGAKACVVAGLATDYCVSATAR